MTEIATLVAIGFLALNLVIDNLAAEWSTAWTDLQTAATTAIGAIVNEMSTLGTSISTAVTDVSALITTSPQWDTLTTSIKNAATAASNFKLPDLATLKDQAKTNLELAIGQIQLNWSTLSFVTTGLVSEVGIKLSNMSWSGLAVSFGNLMSQVGTELTEAADSALGEGNVVSTTIQRVNDTFASIQTSFEGISMDEPISAVQSIFSAAYSVYSLFMGVKTDTITSAITALTTMTTSLLNFSSKLVESIDEKTLVDAASGYVTALTNQITTIFGDPEKLGALGTAVGTLATNIGTKLTDALGTEDFGLKIGEAIGAAAGAFVEGATAFVGGLVGEIGKVDISEFQADVDAFVIGFIKGVGSGLATADWSEIGTTIRDAVIQAIVQSFSDKNAMELIPGPMGMIFGKMADILGAPTLGETAEDIKRGLTFGEELDGTALAQSFGTEVQATLPAVGAEMGTNFNSAVASTGTEMGVAAAAAMTAEAPPAPTISMGMPEGGLAALPSMEEILGDAAATGSEIGASFKTAVEPQGIGDEIGQAASLKMAEFTPTQGPDPILSQQRNLMEDIEVPTLEWPPIPEELTGYQFPAPTELEAYQFPEPTSLNQWQFPEPSALLKWNWPSFAMPGWVSQLIGALGGGLRAAGGGGGGGGGGAKAMGTSYWKGGPVWVGEHGKELVNLPQGSEIFPHDESMAMTSGVSIVIENVQVHNGMDIDVLANQLAKRIQQKMRG
jgi:hypothetical protein